MKEALTATRHEDHAPGTTGRFVELLNERFIAHGYEPIVYEPVQEVAKNNIEQEAAQEEIATNKERKLGKGALQAAGLRDKVTSFFKRFSVNKDMLRRRAWGTAAATLGAVAVGAIVARNNPEMAGMIAERVADFGTQINQNGSDILAAGTAPDMPTTPVYTFDAESLNNTVVSRPVTDIYIGGMGDGEGNFFHQAMASQGEQADKTVPVHYPAEIAPISGDATFDESIAAGVDAAYNAIQTELQQGNAVDLKGYSQGTVVMHGALERIAEENGGTLPDSISATFFASPNTPNTGLYESDLFELAEPVLQPLGVTADKSPLPPGSETAAMTTDVVANSANRPLTTQISQAIGYAFGDGHRMPTAEDIADPTRTTTHVVDGVTIHSVKPEGIQTAALRAAQQHGFYVSEAADRLGQAVAPQGEVGGPDPGIDPNEVIRAGAAFLDDTARIHGLADPHLEEAAQGINLNVPPVAPVLPEVELPPVEIPAVEPAPVVAPEVPAAPPELQTAINDVTAAVNDFIETAPPPPVIEAPVIEPPVIPEFVPPAVPEFVPEPAPLPVIEPPVVPEFVPPAIPEIPPAPVFVPPVIPEFVPPAMPEFVPPPEVQQIADQVNGFLNGLQPPQ